MRIIRLEALLLTCYHLHPLSLASHICDAEDAKEVRNSVLPVLLSCLCLRGKEREGMGRKS